MTPFAIQIYYLHLRGDSVERLSLKLQIPAERVAQRLRAAEQYLNRRRPAVMRPN